MDALIPPFALVLDRTFGYSPRLVAAIGHPVIWMGWLISFLETRLNWSGLPGHNRRLGGVVTLGVLLAVTLLAASVIVALARGHFWGWPLLALLASSLLAQHELDRAVTAVADGLERSLDEGREAVSHIVGRDPDALDEAGVSRAAIESLAESTCDGVVAPLFWLILLGLPGIALYKAINTADSMIGHLDERYRDFGWASAKLDDLVNWIPARLTAILIAGAARFVRGADSPAAWSSARRDAMKHDSPNAGWPEAAMAGALGISLGGPREYDGETVDLPTLGDGPSDLGAADIRNALVVYRTALNLLLAITGAVALFFWWIRG
jgi:adenosylcobinamide-phosphate synthase